MFESDAGVLLGRIADASRAEAQDAAARLVAIGDLYRLRLAQNGSREEWAADSCDAVAAEVAAALRTSVAMGLSNLRYARAMHERLPQLGAVFQAGDIDFRLFRTIVFRTDLITDPEALAAVDAQLAIKAPRWPSMTSCKLATEVDRVVVKIDRDAVRRAREDATDRYLEVATMESGMALVNGNVYATTAQALDRRLNELANTVCPDDPRTVKQRRADALGALTAGQDRLACDCDNADCPATSAPRGSVSVVIHVVAERTTLDGSGAPGFLYGDGIIPAEIVRELAKSAKLQPITTPVQPESRYVPSQALVDFVRARDLTCRAPGCDRPATHCDVDHTIPFADGGATHPSNLKCLCRLHHLLKTFWGWRDKQLPDGTVIWSLPDGQTHVTTPGSALLFPTLCASVAVLPSVVPTPDDRCGKRDAMMPTRTRTRAQNRAAAITAERRRTQRARQARQKRFLDAYFGHHPPNPDDPPPF